jgi:single-strand DNA-binding protein
MYNENLVLLTGKLGGEAEIVSLANGAKVAKLSLAVDHNYKDGGGRWRTDVHWIRVVTYLPHLIDTVLATEATKGRTMFVQGTLRARQWEQDGKKHHAVEVEVDHTGGITPIDKDMGPINQVILTGRLGGHADIKTLPGQEGRKVNSASRSIRPTTRLTSKAGHLRKPFMLTA